MKVEVIGPFRGISGYDNHTRAFIRELRRQRVQLRARHFDGWSAPVFSDDALSDILSHDDQWISDPDIVLRFNMPHQADTRWGCKNVCYTMFEADRIIQSWVSQSLQHDLIIVPTLSSKDAWVNSGFPSDKIRVCPLGVDFHRFQSIRHDTSAVEISGYNIPARKHRFLNVADLRPRKNHLGLLRTWLRATTSEDDIVLILKCNPLDALTAWQYEQDIKSLQRSIGKGFSEAAPVITLFESLSEAQINALYRHATHYISMSFGEGWDLPMTEAMAAGLHVIAPLHSAYESYLNPAIATLIPVRKGSASYEGTYHRCDDVWFQDLQWWFPDEDVAADIIRQVIDGTLPMISAAKEYAREHLTWEKATTQLIEILSESLQPQQAVRC